MVLVFLIIGLLLAAFPRAVVRIAGPHEAPGRSATMLRAAGVALALAALGIALLLGP
jgi:hypothetical protein